MPDTLGLPERESLIKAVIENKKRVAEDSATLFLFIFQEKNRSGSVQLPEPCLVLNGDPFLLACEVLKFVKYRIRSFLRAVVCL